MFRIVVVIHDGYDLIIKLNSNHKETLNIFTVNIYGTLKFMVYLHRRKLLVATMFGK
jgi:hypothetical protein